MEIHVKSTPILAAMTAALCLALAGCGNNEKPKATQAQQQAAANQQETAKYNLYVDAANRSEDFADTLNKHIELYAKPLASGKPLANYSMFTSYSVVNAQKALKSALALQPPMPELDGPATEMLTALAKLAPVQAELNSYADSSGFLADNGKKARELEPAFQAAMLDVAKAQAKFYDGISARDEINTKTAFENAPKDTTAYYRAGAILYSKQAARLSTPFFESAGGAQETAAFEQSLNQSGDMIEQWDKKLRASNPAGCSAMIQINDFLSRGRSAIRNAKQGLYTPHGDKMIWKLTNPLPSDAAQFNRGFANMIEGINQNGCA